MSLRRLTIGIGSGIADKVVVSLVQLALVPVLANAWGLTLFGIWAMVMTIPGILVLGDFGIVTAAWSRMTMFVSRGEQEHARTSLHTAWLVTTGICLCLVLLCAATLLLLPAGIVPVTSGFGESEARQVILMLMIYGLATVVFRLNTVIFRASGNFPLTSWCNTASYAAENLALVLVVFLGADPVEAAATLLAMRCLSIAVVFLISFTRYKQLRPGFAHASRSEWRELWRPALAASSLGFGTIAFLQGSVIALGTAAGAAAVPAFVAVRTLSRLGLQFSLMIAHPVAQEFGQELARGHNFRAGRYFGVVLATSVVLGCGMAAGLILFGMPVVRIWTGGAIEASGALILFMALSSCMAVLWNALSNLMLVLNRQGAIAHANLAVSIAGLAFIAFAGGWLGAVAAGIAFAFADFVTLLAVAMFVWRNWWPDPDFRQGSQASIVEMRSPLSTLKALRRRVG